MKQAFLNLIRLLIRFSPQLSLISHCVFAHIWPFLAFISLAFHLINYLVRADALI